MDRILYNPRVKSLGFGSRFSAALPSPRPSIPWQCAQLSSYTSLPWAETSGASCVNTCIDIKKVKPIIIDRRTNRFLNTLVSLPKGSIFITCIVR